LHQFLLATELCPAELGDMAALSKIGKGAAGKIGALSDWVSEGIWFRGSRSNEETIKPFTNVTLDEQLAKNYASPTTEQSNITTMKLKLSHDEIFDLKNPDHVKMAKEKGLFDELEDEIEASDLVDMNLPEGHPLEYSSDFEFLESYENELKDIGFKGFFDWNESGIRVFDPKSIEVISRMNIDGKSID
jgi:hypothetical protein